MARSRQAKRAVDGRYGDQACATYRHLGEILARDDIDAVMIATGDRWHALASIYAMRTGKDVFSEKPSSMTIAEGQAVVETADRLRRVYQTGLQRLSDERYLSVDGSQLFGADRPEVPDFRVCFFLHYFDASTGVAAPDGDLPPSELTEMPERLAKICVYEHPG